MDPHQASLAKSFGEVRQLDRPRDKYFCNKCNISFSHCEQFALHNRMHDDINTCYTCGTTMQENGCICKQCLMAYSRKGFAEHKRMPEQAEYSMNGVPMVADSSYRYESAYRLAENSYPAMEQAYDMSLPHKNTPTTTTTTADVSHQQVQNTNFQTSEMNLSTRHNTELNLSTNTSTELNLTTQTVQQGQNSSEPVAVENEVVKDKTAEEQAMKQTESIVAAEPEVVAETTSISTLGSTNGASDEAPLPEPIVKIEEPEVKVEIDDDIEAYLDEDEEDVIAEDPKGLKLRRRRPRKCKTPQKKIVKKRRPRKANPLQCKKCKVIFDSIGELEEHKIGPPCVTFSCEVCGKVYYKRNDLTRHLPAHSDAKPYACKECADRFKKKEQLAKHMRRHTGEKPYKCEYCGMKFSLGGNLKIHVRTHTGEKPYSCPHCGKEFAQKSHLNTHVKMHLGIKPFSCETCGKMFCEKGNLQKHARVHTGAKPYKCKFCDKFYGSASYVSKHMKKEHFAQYMRFKVERKYNAWRKPFTPKPLKKGQKKKKGKRRILKIKQPAMPHTCDICGITLSHKSYLAAHKRIHSGEKPHQCKICGKHFTQRSQLNTHAKIHTGIKPYKCDTCDKAFFERAGLVKHTRIHTGERPYPCSNCDKRFRCTSNLAKHRKKGHCLKNVNNPQQPPPEKNFKCDICNKAYAAKPSLAKHMRVHTDAFFEGNNQQAQVAQVTQGAPNTHLINNTHINHTPTPTPPINTPISMEQTLPLSRPLLPPPPTIQNYDPYPTMCPPQPAYHHGNQDPTAPQYRPAYYPALNPAANYGPVCYPGVDQWSGF